MSSIQIFTISIILQTKTITTNLCTNLPISIIWRSHLFIWGTHNQFDPTCTLCWGWSPYIIRVGSLPIHFNFSANISVVPEVGRLTSSPLETPTHFKHCRHLTLPVENIWAPRSFVRAEPSSKQTSYTTAWDRCSLPAPHWSRPTANSGSLTWEKRFLASATTHGWCTQ